MLWMDEEARAMAQDWFEGGVPRCPRCGALIEARELEEFAVPIVAVFLACHECAAHGVYTPDPSGPRWTREEMQDVVAKLWLGDEARCPRDRAVLGVRTRRLPGTPTELQVHCRACGQSFRSGDLEDSARESTGEYIVSAFQARIASARR